MTYIDNARISSLRADLIERANDGAEAWSKDVLLAKQATDDRLVALEDAVSQLNQTVGSLMAQLAALKV